jgi:hypothetical protein
MKSSKGPANKPSINYVTGRIIDILFEERKVATVTVTDQASGVMVEPVTAAVTNPNPAGTASQPPTSTIPTRPATTPARPTTAPPATTAPPKPPPQR